MSDRTKPIPPRYPCVYYPQYCKGCRVQNCPYKEVRKNDTQD